MIDEREKPVPLPHPLRPIEELPPTDELEDVPPLPPSERSTKPLRPPEEIAESPLNRQFTA
jgi:hypothetical protein